MSIDEIVWWMGVILFLVCALWVIIPSKKNEVIKENIEEVDPHSEESDYIKPVLKQLTKEQIDDIHARGKITPAEMVKEWEDMDLCAPGDAIGSAAWRCKKFHHNCHDCLVDYANERDEHISFFTVIKQCNFRL